MRKNFTIVLILGLIAIVLIGIFIIDRSEKSDSIDHQNSRDSLLADNGRSAYGVPRLEPDWVVHLRTNRSIYWTSRIRGVPDNLPLHLAKTVFVEGDSTISEKDDYHYQVNDSIGYRLVLKHGYLGNGKWESIEREFLTYTFEEYSNVSSKVVDRQFADSVLHEWSIISKKPLMP